MVLQPSEAPAQGNHIHNPWMEYAGWESSLTWVEGSADHTRHDNEKHREYFQIARQHRSTLRMRDALGGEGPLNYHLHQWENAKR